VGATGKGCNKVASTSAVLHAILVKSILNPVSLNNPTRTPPGARALTGGAIATFIGILLLVFGPSPSPGFPLNPHQMAWVFIGIGGALLAIGALARILFRE
jgi:hypothetical protein